MLKYVSFLCEQCSFSLPYTHYCSLGSPSSLVPPVLDPSPTDQRPLHPPTQHHRCASWHVLCADQLRSRTAKGEVDLTHCPTLRATKLGLQRTCTFLHLRTDLCTCCIKLCSAVQDVRCDAQVRVLGCMPRNGLHGDCCDTSLASINYPTAVTRV